MKRLPSFLIFLAALAVLAGVLLSKMSFLARTAISIFRKHYADYTFMKTWWKGAFLFFAVWLLLLGLQSLAERKLVRAQSNWVQGGCIVLALLGLYYTYHDFRSDLSHRWAGERLHLGFYLFWLGWISISFFVLYGRRKIPTSSGNTVAANE